MLQKLTNIILAFLVLLSSSGLVINYHYCGVELKDSSFFVEAEACNHETPVMPSCPFHQQVQKSHKPAKKGCCGEEVQFLKLEIPQQAQSFDFQAVKTFLLTGMLPSKLDAEAIIPDTRQNYYSIYNPPPLLCDVPVMLQTFLC